GLSAISGVLESPIGDEPHGEVRVIEGNRPGTVDARKGRRILNRPCLTAVNASRLENGLWLRGINGMGVFLIEVRPTKEPDEDLIAPTPDPVIGGPSVKIFLTARDDHILDIRLGATDRAAQQAKHCDAQKCRSRRMAEGCHHVSSSS